MTKDEWLQLRCPNDPAVTGCAWCGKGPVRNTLDGDDLCGPCTDLWVRGEGAEARRMDHQTTGAERRAGKPILAASHSLLNPNGETK